MELQILETAITELAEDQKTTGQQIETFTQQIKEIGEKVDAFSDKLANLQVVAPPLDTKPIDYQLSEHFQNVTKILEGQPKNVVRQFRFLLFPADNADYYYRIIFGRLFGWAVLILVCTYLFSLGQQYIEKSTAAANRRYYYETYQDAWNRLDSLLGASGRKKMQEALQQAEKDQ
jgi:hypothetical protein